EAASGRRRYFLKFRAIHVAEQLRPLRPSRPPSLLIYDWEDVAVGDKQVGKSVIVEVEKSGAPAKKWNRRIHQPGSIRYIRDNAIAFVAKQHVVIVAKIRDVKIDFAIAVVVTHRNS